MPDAIRFRGPICVAVNLAFGRSFQFGDTRRRLEFRVEANNVLNQVSIYQCRHGSECHELMACPSAARHAHLGCRDEVPVLKHLAIVLTAALLAAQLSSQQSADVFHARPTWWW